MNVFCCLWTLCLQNQIKSKVRPTSCPAAILMPEITEKMHKLLHKNTYWIVRNTKGHSSKKLDPTVLNFLSHMSWMRDHVWYKFYETHTNGTEIVKQNTYLTVVTKGHNSNKPDSQIQFSCNACKAWRLSVTNYIQMKIISIWDWRYGSYEAKPYLLTKGWKRGLQNYIPLNKQINA